jgi:hypothetical protein
MISFDKTNSGTNSNVLVSFRLEIGTLVERLWNVCSFTVLTLQALNKVLLLSERCLYCANIKSLHTTAMKYLLFRYSNPELCSKPVRALKNIYIYKPSSIRFKNIKTHQLILHRRTFKASVTALDQTHCIFRCTWSPSWLFVSNKLRTRIASFYFCKIWRIYQAELPNVFCVLKQARATLGLGLCGPMLLFKATYL